MRAFLTNTIETIIQTEAGEKRLRIWEIRIQRKVYGPLRTEYGDWRIRTHFQLETLINGACTTRFIKRTEIEVVGTYNKDSVQRTVK